ncbi:MAG: SH3 domain-containing protein [Hyphomicrobiaceae bacterium]|nr:SH3 domain-containing protein [Hyphomicrobiaceae bacterium]
MTFRAMVFGLAAAASLAATIAPAQAAGKGFGCFLVTASEVNIRARPYSDAKVVGTALKGDILIKRKMLCTLRGYWCAIRAGSVDGYVDKAFMEKITCP